MTVNWCDECLDLHRDGAKCYPKWEVWCVDWSGDDMTDAPSVVRVRDVEHAAERWGDELACEDMQSALDGLDLLVRSSDGEVSRVHLCGEVVPSWTVREVTNGS